MPEIETKKIPLTGLDAVKALEALQDNPELRAFFMQGLLEQGYELEKLIKSLTESLPETVDDRVAKQIQTSVDELNKKLEAIHDAIGDLPQNLDQQIALFRDVITETREQVNQEVDALQTKVETINSMALNTIAQSMRDNVHVFEKELREAKDKVFSEGVETIKETNRQANWILIVGVTVIAIGAQVIGYFLK
ncbi:hypothetical protein [Xenorhabdus bovienii]|uniref:hypothetical protein n=1 Tax=Xenorhabdus bovienii TaxID=40576 RepID=UPI0023B2FAF4|nr:hypothetical protein [Xenorhabdus bovienii]MDE9544180.1 hypothetical protein [Xenorhabdus bovienii]